MRVVCVVVVVCGGGGGSGGGGGIDEARLGLTLIYCWTQIQIKYGALDI